METHTMRNELKYQIIGEFQAHGYKERTCITYAEALLRLCQDS